MYFYFAISKKKKFWLDEIFELELKKIKVKINKSAWQLKQLKKKKHPYTRFLWINALVTAQVNGRPSKIKFV